MASAEVMKQRNLESSILFMQQEHADTLKGLHSEIHKLQQRCSELTFHLAMEQTSTVAETGNDQKLMETLEANLNTAKKSISEQKVLLETKERKIQKLEQQLKAVERKYKDELKHKQFCITKLETEMQERCNELASLRMTVLTSRTSHHHQASKPIHSNQDLGLHASNSSTRHSQHMGVESSTNNSRRLSGQYEQMSKLSREESFSSRDSQEDFDVESSNLFSHQIPVRPLQTAVPSGKVVPVSQISTERKSSGKHRRSSASNRPLTEVKKRPASGRKLVLDQTLIESGDLKLPVDDEEILKIVAQQKEALNLRQGKGMIVPPIHSKQDVGEVTKKLSPRSANSASFARRVRKQVTETTATGGDKGTSPEVEIETLAVDTINTDLRKAQEFNRTDT